MIKHSKGLKVYYIVLLGKNIMQLEQTKLGYDKNAAQSQLKATSANLRTLAYFTAKRAIDIIAASVVLLVFGIPMLIIAMLIEIETPGSAIFAQERVTARRRRIVNGKAEFDVVTFT